MPAVSAVLAALTAEAEAIRAARYDSLAALHLATAAQFNALPRQSLRHSDLRAIKQGIERNQSLLRAAMDGIAAAQARMTDLISVQQELRVYDPSGLQTTHANLHKGFEKKA